jgi:hypothetical protein
MDNTMDSSKVVETSATQVILPTLLVLAAGGRIRSGLPVLGDFADQL